MPLCGAHAANQTRNLFAGGRLPSNFNIIIIIIVSPSNRGSIIIACVFVTRLALTGKAYKAGAPRFFEPRIRPSVSPFPLFYARFVLLLRGGGTRNLGEGEHGGPGVIVPLFFSFSFSSFHFFSRKELC